MIGLARFSSITEYWQKAREHRKSPRSTQSSLDIRNKICNYLSFEFNRFKQSGLISIWSLISNNATLHQKAIVLIYIKNRDKKSMSSKFIST